MNTSQNTDQNSTQQSITSNQHLTQLDSPQPFNEGMSDSESLMSEDLRGFDGPTQYDVIMETRHSGPPTNDELKLMVSMASEANLNEIKDIIY